MLEEDTYKVLYFHLIFQGSLNLFLFFAASFFLYESDFKFLMRCVNVEEIYVNVKEIYNLKYHLLQSFSVPWPLAMLRYYMISIR